MKKTSLLILILVLLPNLISAEEKYLPQKNYECITKRATQLYSKKMVEKALDYMALQITSELKDKNPTFLCVLSGGIVTTGQLLTRLDFPLKLDYIHATRYGGKMDGGELKLLATPKNSIQDQVVVIVDDIIDTGKTLQAVVDYCFKQGAREVYTAALVDKKGRREDAGLCKANFVGLEIPNQFIIGYGLDYEEYFRNLDGIFVMPKEQFSSIELFAKKE